LKKVKATMNSYFIYVKFPHKKRFQPINLKEKKPVINLIYASIVDEQYVDTVLDDLRKGNPTYQFEKRKAG